MTIPGYLQLGGLFLAAAFGLGWLAACRLVTDPLERLVGAAVIGLVGCFVAGFLLHVLRLSLFWLALAPLAGAVALAVGHRAAREAWAPREVRSAVFAWGALALFLQALLATVQSYHGAAWGGDWLEHHQRALFFREHWPRDFNFFGDYLLPARPPLVNVVVAGAQAWATPVFATDQVVLAAWSSLAFLPAALLCRRAGGSGRLPLLAGLCALSPFFLQNSTFAWTKLPTAFFVLAGAHFLLAALERPAARGAFALAVLALTAGLLSHYSAGPYCVVLAAWWLAWRLRHREFARLGRESLAGLLLAPPLLALWFGWSLHHYGLAGTFLSNSTVIAGGPPGFLAQAGKVAANLWATLVPHPLRTVDYALIRHGDELTRFRDYFFLISQVNLPALLGSGGALGLAVAAWRDRRAWRSGPGPTRPAWTLPAVAALVVLGVAVHGAPDDWGLAHICLQPLALAGLAVLAARLPTLPPVALVVLGLGLLWDGVVNIGLHYWLQAQPPRPDWLHAPDLGLLLREEGPAAFNAGLKQVTGVRFLRDCLPSHAAPVLVLVALLAAVLAWRSSPGRRERDSIP